MDINKIDEGFLLFDWFNNAKASLKKVDESLENPKQYISSVFFSNEKFQGFSIPAELIQEEIRCALLKYKQYLENRIEELTKQIEEL